MVESGRVLGKGRIKASIEKLSGGVPKNGRISVSTEKWKNRGEYTPPNRLIASPLAMEEIKTK